MIPLIIILCVVIFLICFLVTIRKHDYYWIVKFFGDYMVIDNNCDIGDIRRYKFVSDIRNATKFVTYKSALKHLWYHISCSTD